MCKYLPANAYLPRAGLAHKSVTNHVDEYNDLRRSATRNIMWKGIPATVAMKITGHWHE
jgi:hypothetical protein